MTLPKTVVILMNSPLLPLKAPTSNPVSILSNCRNSYTVLAANLAAASATSPLSLTMRMIRGPRLPHLHLDPDDRDARQATRPPPARRSTIEPAARPTTEDEDAARWPMMPTEDRGACLPSQSRARRAGRHARNKTDGETETNRCGR